MNHTFLSHTFIAALALIAMTATVGVFAQTDTTQTTTLRATDIRADKLGTSAVIASLASGVVLRVLSLEGGWAWVESSGVRGWARANTLNLQSGASSASGLDSGR